jgi:anti-sigma factor RsiW
VTDHRSWTHASAEVLQAFLDGELGETEARDVRRHAASCARCRSHLEAWSLLFQELGSLGEMAPSAGFAERVIEALPQPVPARLPWLGRAWGWRRRLRPVALEHAAAESIQELIDGELAPRVAAATEAHLEGCRACRDELETWRALVLHLDGLPRLTPSADFAERVMAHVRVRSAAAVGRPRLRERIAAWLELNGRTRKRLAALAGAGVTPVVVVASMMYTIFSHPLVTPGNLLSFLWLKARDGLGETLAIVAGRISASPAAAEVHALLEVMTRSTETAAAASALLGALMLSAVWVLYRNLFAPSLAENRYARLPF